MSKNVEIKQEAVERMKILKLHPNVINEFIKENKLNKSEGPLGTLYWLNDKEQELVKNFEKYNDRRIYHVIHTFSNLGETYDLLFVGNEEEEWDYEREDLKLGIAFSKTEVMECRYNSEYGSIGIKSLNGGLVRIS